MEFSLTNSKEKWQIRLTPKKVQRKMNSSSSERKIGHFGGDRAHRPKESGRAEGSTEKLRSRALETANQHTPVHHPLDGSFDSVVDESQLSYNLVSSW